jgi:hypothetical protein
MHTADVATCAAAGLAHVRVDVREACAVLPVQRHDGATTRRPLRGRLQRDSGRELAHVCLGEGGRGGGGGKHGK